MKNLQLTKLRKPLNAIEMAELLEVVSNVDQEQAASLRRLMFEVESFREMKKGSNQSGHKE